MVAYADQDKRVLRNPLNDFLSKEAVAGLILVACAAVALLLARECPYPEIRRSLRSLTPWAACRWRWRCWLTSWGSGRHS